jgi:uncharacterized membrane protein (UPF0127 family)
MIKNISQSKVIVGSLEICNSVFSRGLGLMFRKKLADKGLVFIFNSERKRSLHNLFVFWPIDVLFLDSQKKVVEVKHNFKPFRFYFPKKKAQYVIELPSGSASSCEIGHTISFK